MTLQPISLTPERMAQLLAYAQRHGKDAATALDDVLAAYLTAEQEEYEDTVKAVTQAYDQVKAGHARPAEGPLEEIRLRYGFPR